MQRGTSLRPVGVGIAQTFLPLWKDEAEQGKTALGEEAPPEEAARAYMTRPHKKHRGEFARLNFP